MAVDLRSGIALPEPEKGQLETFAWPDIDDVFLREGSLVVRRRPGTGTHGELAVVLAFIANLPVLFDLVAQLRGQPGTG